MPRTPKGSAALIAGPKHAFLTVMRNAELFLVAALGALGVAHCGGAVSGGSGASSGASSGRGASGATADGASGASGYGTPQDCSNAGGQCVLAGGGGLCAKQGPTNTCNCNPGCNPGGAICCIEWVDAGEAGANGSAPSGSEAGSVESGGPTCVPHNGIYTCLGGTWPACVTTSFGAFLSCPPGATSCMGCYEGSGYVSSCGDGGPPGVGTEYSCQ